MVDPTTRVGALTFMQNQSVSGRLEAFANEI